MAEKITVEQLEALEDAQFFGRNDEFHQMLEEYAGIKAKAYTGFSYYDSAGTYLGDSNYCDVMDLLKAAYIKVEQEGG